MNTQTDCETNAREALKKAKGKITITLSDTKPAPWAKDESQYRPHYKVTMRGPGGSYTFDFWASINDGMNGTTPGTYDVIACLEWHRPLGFADFCSEFGYDIDSRKAEATFKAVDAQARALERIFPDEQSRNQLAEIR